MRILEALVFLTAIAAAYAAIRSIRATIGESPFLFLRLLTFSQDPLPSFIALLGFLIPLVAIALSFDAINGEFNRRTMSRILAQPIYRDALLLGKFFAGLLALTIGLVSLWLLVLGLGLLLLASREHRGDGADARFSRRHHRLCGVWLAVALLFSVVFRARRRPPSRARHLAPLRPLLVGDHSAHRQFDRRAAEGVFGPRMEFLQARRSSTASRQHALCRERARAVAPGDARPGTGIDQPAARRAPGAPLPARRASSSFGRS